MPNKNFTEPPESDEYCGAEIESNPGHYCSNKASRPDGRCGQHPEDEDYEPGGGYWKHGANATPSNYYERLDEEQKDWVNAVYWSFLEDAPFDEESKGKCELLWNVAIDIHKQRSVDDYLADEGMVQERFAGAGESGVYYEDEENVLHLTYDRLSRSNIRTLKELGILDDPDSQKADAQRSLVDIFSTNFED